MRIVVSYSTRCENNLVFYYVGAFSAKGAEMDGAAAERDGAGGRGQRERR